MALGTGRRNGTARVNLDSIPDSGQRGFSLQVPSAPLTNPPAGLLTRTGDGHTATSWAETQQAQPAPAPTEPTTETRPDPQLLCRKVTGASLTHTSQGPCSPEFGHSRDEPSLNCLIKDSSHPAPRLSTAHNALPASSLSTKPGLCPAFWPGWIFPPVPLRRTRICPFAPSFVHHPQHQHCSGQNVSLRRLGISQQVF